MEIECFLLVFFFQDAHLLAEVLVLDALLIYLDPLMTLLFHRNKIRFLLDETSPKKGHSRMVWKSELATRKKWEHILFFSYI